MREGSLADGINDFGGTAAHESGSGGIIRLRAHLGGQPQDALPIGLQQPPL